MTTGSAEDDRHLLARSIRATSFVRSSQLYRLSLIFDVTFDCIENLGG